jgi:hypothetical protein
MKKAWIDGKECYRLSLKENFSFKFIWNEMKIVRSMRRMRRLLLLWLVRRLRRLFMRDRRRRGGGKGSS